MSTFDPETLIPPCETIVVHRVAKLLSVSTSHIRNLIEDGEIKVPRKKLARARKGKKSWTMVSIDRAHVIEFLRERKVPQKPGQKVTGAKGLR